MLRHRPVHQHLGLDDRHDIVRLAQRRIAGQRRGIGGNRIGRGNALADIDHRPPFGEAGAEPVIVLEALAETVEPFGDLLAREERNILGAAIDLYAGERPVAVILSTSARPSLAFWRMVSSNRITPEMWLRIASRAVNIISR